MKFYPCGAVAHILHREMTRDEIWSSVAYRRSHLRISSARDKSEASTRRVTNRRAATGWHRASILEARNTDCANRHYRGCCPSRLAGASRSMPCSRNICCMDFPLPSSRKRCSAPGLGQMTLAWPSWAVPQPRTPGLHTGLRVSCALLCFGQPLAAYPPVVQDLVAGSASATWRDAKHQSLDGPIRL